MTYQEALAEAGPGARRVGIACRDRRVLGYYVGDNDDKIVAFFRDGQHIPTPRCLTTENTEAFAEAGPCGDCPFARADA